jgi:hypothetical protein
MLISLGSIDEQTRAINIPTMDEQTDRGNQYTYVGIIDRQGQLNIGISITPVYLFSHRRYVDFPCLSLSIVGILQQFKKNKKRHVNL